MEFQKNSARYSPGGSTRDAAYFDPYPIFVDHGQGRYLNDVDGNRYIDFVINAGSLIMGHAHPLIVLAVQEQALKGTAFNGPTESQIRLAKILCDRIPSMETIRFTNSGTEGTLMAIRAARAFTGRQKIAKFEGGYHGAHEYVSVSVTPSEERLDPKGPTAVLEYPGQPDSVAQDVVVLPYNDLESCERIIKENGTDLACIIMEPIASAFGYLPGIQEFLEGIRFLTKEMGILLIFDEVQSLRVDIGGAQGLYGVIPDLTALGKTIGGGMPVGAFGGREDVMSLYDLARSEIGLKHSGTFNANPMTMVAGEVTMNHLTSDTFERLNGLGEILRKKLRAVFDELGVSAQVTGVSSFFGIHFTSEEIKDYRTVLRSDQELKKALHMGLLNQNVLIQTQCAGSLSTLTTEEDIDVLVDLTSRVVQRIR